MNSPHPSTVGLYIHVPFCETKCDYCDFYSVPLADRDTPRLTRALVQELDQRESSPPGEFHTIFVGGGTPTLLPFDDMKLLFGRLAEVVHNCKVAEFTTEANPATVDQIKIDLLIDSGVNRISLGGQSFHLSELQVLQRLHDPSDIVSSVHIARLGGIGHVNLDLIFGIPGQSLATWRESLQRAVDLGIDHLACYGLTYETNTPLSKRVRQGLITPCENDLEADMYLMCLEFLKEQGFEQYEISNFARPGCECRHNLIYWSNLPYLGIGPSAASYIDGVRSKNVSHVETYVGDIESGCSAAREQEKLTGPALAGETAMLQLRMNRGIDVARFESQVGINPLELFRETLERFADRGLLKFSDDCIHLTDSGRVLADRIIAELLATSQQDSAPCSE